MANSDVILAVDQGAFVPSADSIPVIKGDTLSLHNTGTGPAFLFFSPDAISALSPNPGSPFAIAAGPKAVFTFLSSAPAAHPVYLGSRPAASPPLFSRDVVPSIAL